MSVTKSIYFGQYLKPEKYPDPYSPQAKEFYSSDKATDGQKDAYLKFTAPGMLVTIIKELVPNLLNEGTCNSGSITLTSTERFESGLKSKLIQVFKLSQARTSDNPTGDYRPKEDFEGFYANVFKLTFNELRCIDNNALTLLTHIFLKTLREKFKEETGKTPAEYFKALR